MPRAPGEDDLRQASMQALALDTAGHMPVQLVIPKLHVIFALSPLSQTSVFNGYSNAAPVNIVSIILAISQQSSLEPQVRFIGSHAGDPAVLPRRAEIRRQGAESSRQPSQHHRPDHAREHRQTPAHVAALAGSAPTHRAIRRTEPVIAGLTSRAVARPPGLAWSARSPAPRRQHGPDRGRLHDARQRGRRCRLPR